MQTYVLTGTEAAVVNADLMASRGGISDQVRRSLEFGAAVSADQRDAARAFQLGWKALFAQFLDRV